MTAKLKHILNADRVLFSVPLRSKKQVFELIAKTIEMSDANLRAHAILDGLIARERLGGTAIGHGVAIPHTRLEFAQDAVGCFILLKDSIQDFNAEDKIPIDMVFALVVPEEANQAHLALLADLVRILRDPEFRQDIRQCTSQDQLYKTLMNAI